MKDVHTEHCCAENGCKYGEEDSCTVWLGYKKQSCGYWDGEREHPIPNISEEEFQQRRKGVENNLCIDDDYDYEAPKQKEVEKKKIRVTYQVQFECIVDEDEIENIDIPEGGANNSTYVCNSYEIIDQEEL